MSDDSIPTTEPDNSPVSDDLTSDTGFIHKSIESLIESLEQLRVFAKFTPIAQDDLVVKWAIIILEFLQKNSSLLDAAIAWLFQDDEDPNNAFIQAIESSEDPELQVAAYAWRENSESLGKFNFHEMNA